MAHIHEKIDFTVAIFVVQDERVLLVHHRNLKKWLPLGGHIELDEEPETAALREGKEEGERRPAIPTETLYTIAEGVSSALAKAGPDQELAVLSIRNQKHFGLFDRNFLTSFVTYVKGEQLSVDRDRTVIAYCT